MERARRAASASSTLPPVLVSSRIASSRGNPISVIRAMASSEGAEGVWLGRGREEVAEEVVV